VPLCASHIAAQNAVECVYPLIIVEYHPAVKQHIRLTTHDVKRSSYSLSKLAMQMFNVELANKLQQAGSKVTANSLDPGGRMSLNASAPAPGPLRDTACMRAAQKAL